MQLLLHAGDRRKLLHLRRWAAALRRGRLSEDISGRGCSPAVGLARALDRIITSCTTAARRKCAIPQRCNEPHGDTVVSVQFALQQTSD
jgi:hypothetical protein